MPNLKDIKRRMISVKNTQKITHAMKLVSAAKFARANHAVLNARPYGDSFEQMVAKVIRSSENLSSKLTENRSNFKKELLILVATDRGLCGSLNSGLFKNTTRFVEERRSQGVSLDVVAWGRRAGLFCRKSQWGIISEKEKVTDRPKYSVAESLVAELLPVYLGGEYNAVHIAYVEFKSALSQVPTIRQLLPVVALADGGASTTAASPGSYLPGSYLPGSYLIVEPQLPDLLEPLLERLMVSKIFRILLESAASEHGARMTAMDSASKNAKEVVRKLSLQYNRGRQAAITKELIEITSGADAL